MPTELTSILTLATFVALCGLAIGSYLNVVVHRLPLGVSTVWPRSRCPGCEQPIAARDNIPLVSFLLLRGRCRHCSVKISLRYPAVELATCLLFLGVFVRAPDRWGLGIGCLFVALLLALALIDYDHLLLPDVLTKPGALAGLALSFVSPYSSPVSSVIAYLLGGGVLLLLIAIWWVLRGKWAMGLGDPKMLAMIGAFLGISGVLVTILFASLIGSLIALVLIAFGKAEIGSKLPFGVYLAIGALIALFFDEPLIEWYVSLL